KRGYIMAGRYKENILKHPSLDSQSDNYEKHVAAAERQKPGDLSPEEAAVWDVIAPLMSALNRLHAQFIDFVVEYCIVSARIKRLRKFLDEHDWYYTTESTHGIQHKRFPQAAQLNDDWRKWNQLVAQLGLSPGTALRFNEDSNAKPENPFDDI
ncbi:hypothetical protein C1141_20035, partial [Vibrio agarivorans]